MNKKEHTNTVATTFIQSPEFKEIIKQAIEIGFNAGARAINKCGDISNLDLAKEAATEEVFRILKINNIY